VWSIALANDVDDIEVGDAPVRKLSKGAVEDLIGFRFRRIQNEMSRRFKQRIARVDVNPGMFSAMALIQANPGLSQSELAAEIGMDRATVVALLDALEKNGWARRTRDSVDRRRTACRSRRKAAANWCGWSNWRVRTRRQSAARLAPRVSMISASSSTGSMPLSPARRPLRTHRRRRPVADNLSAELQIVLISTKLRTGAR
jgi:DNA-binding Lrp family transcriptional regulator